MGSRSKAMRSAGLLLAAALVLPVLGGCNEPRFLVPSPTLRGVTIPLPPPSFSDEVLFVIDVEGAVPLGSQGPDNRAFLYEKGTGRGYFVYTDQQTFTIEDVLIDITDNCLQTWFVDGVDGEESTGAEYKAVLLEGEEACSDPTCSAMDGVGACVCLEAWTTGC